jgi:hypothetical protein
MVGFVSFDVFFLSVLTTFDRNRYFEYERRSSVGTTYRLQSQDTNSKADFLESRKCIAAVY